MARYILLAILVLGAAFGGAFVTNLIMEKRSKPSYDLVGYDPTSDSMNDVAAEMETPERRFVLIGEVELADDSVVISVDVDGQSFAFPKKFMEGVGDHIASELLAGLPIAVTYCNETECVRVFTRDASLGKIKLDQFGLVDGGLAVQLNGDVYAQESKEIPLDDYMFSLVNWAAWKESHPDGLVLTEIFWKDEPDE